MRRYSYGEGMLTHFPSVLVFASHWQQEGSCLLPRKVWFQRLPNPSLWRAPPAGETDCQVGSHVVQAHCVGLCGCAHVCECMFALMSIFLVCVLVKALQSFRWLVLPRAEAPFSPPLLCLSPPFSPIPQPVEQPRPTLPLTPAPSEGSWGKVPFRMPSLTAPSGSWRHLCIGYCTDVPRLCSSATITTQLPERAS